MRAVIVMTMTAVIVRTVISGQVGMIDLMSTAGEMTDCTRFITQGSNVKTIGSRLMGQRNLILG